MLRPYSMKDPPRSDGRTFLAYAFLEYCTLEWCLGPDDIERALDGDQADSWSTERVLMSTRALGELFLRDEVRTYIRPFGGGVPTRLEKQCWELDDFVQRFRLSAIDPRAPFSPEAPPTHWLFVDAEQFELILQRVIMASVPGAEMLVRKAGTNNVGDAAEAPSQRPFSRLPLETVQSRPDRFLRLEEVLARSGVSRSTLYDWIRLGRFPRQKRIGGNVAVWTESEVQAWLLQATTAEGRSA